RMLRNNSGGSHSIAYGLTVDHVIELTTILADGSRVVFGEVTPEQFAAKCKAPGLEGQIYREIARIRETYGDEIRTRYPAHWRRVSGYNLNELVGVGLRPPRSAGQPLNVARLIVGSGGTFGAVGQGKVRPEGSFGGVVGAKVPLVRRPNRTALAVIHYRDVQEALESSQAILETGPYAV